MSRATATSRAKNKTNTLSYFFLFVILCAIIIVVWVQSKEVEAKLTSSRVQETELDMKIEAQEARAEEIAEYEKYVQTKAYAEEQAEQKLGLVNEGEIVFKRE